MKIFPFVPALFESFLPNLADAGGRRCARGDESGVCEHGAAGDEAVADLQRPVRPLVLLVITHFCLGAVSSLS